MSTNRHRTESSLHPVIIHLDLDAFYAQVEMRRLGLANDQPCCVQQWSSLIAVNYPARLWGISRFDKAKAAKRKCPFVKLVHTEIIGDASKAQPHVQAIQSDSNNNDAQKSRGSSEAEANVTDGELIDDADARDYTAINLQSKVSLARYRQASKRIFKLLENSAGVQNVEKAGLDEAFIDVSGIVSEIREAISGGQSDGITIEQIMEHAKRCVNRESAQHRKAEQAQQERRERLEKWFNGNPKRCLMDSEAFVPSRNESEVEKSVVKRWIQLDEVPEWWCIPDIVQGDDIDSTATPILNSKSFMDQSIVIGSHVAQSLRRTILNELGYTTGVGVARNKMLAKVGSARNKPDQQTLITSHCIDKVMKELPIGKIRFLGGKIGNQLMEHFRLSTAGEAQQLSLTQLRTVFDESTADWIHRVVRGEDSSEVQPRKDAKSMMSVKSISPVKNYEGTYPWLQILVDEITDRVNEELEENSRYPKSLTLYYRKTGAGKGTYMGKSKATSMPSSHALSKEELLKKAKQLVHTVSPRDLFPCNRLGLSAMNFLKVGSHGFQDLSQMFQRTQDKRSTDSPSAELSGPSDTCSTEDTQNNKDGVIEIFCHSSNKPVSSEPFVCPICKRSIDVLSTGEMNEHVNSCLDGSSTNAASAGDGRKRRKTSNGFPDIRNLMGVRNPNE
eukprot:gb/GECG01013683.1/.p1 GENE.gb/GECG01013683.1/~~gb/GECG01013683.1/.p1  ORF type:complete len:673 (+),score=84.41 gb/GECG01013683.1/:1-2019(+)